MKLMNTDYYGFDLNFSRAISFEGCKRICDEACSCEGFNYKEGEATCYAKSALFNGYSSPGFPGTLYLKVPRSLEDGLGLDNDFEGSDAVCEASGATVLVGSPSMYDLSNRMLRWSYLYGFAGIIGGIEAFLAVVAWWFLFRRGASTSAEDGYRTITSQFKVFSYAELKSATSNFKDQIGQGGSGAVYKGVLEDGSVVAVKRLGDVMQSEEVFKAELSTIGRINHMNLVRMWGFCSENRHRLIVYEYVEQLSLDKHLFPSPNSLGWKERFTVALGTAKALAYLHHECLEWVIHCDVKPENILLDGNFEPKMADFGLAKLSQRGGPVSEFSHIRGTKGYMAPEWASNLPITAKVDVYSFGVVMLELVRGVRLSNWVVVGDGSEQEAELTRFVREAKQKIRGEEEESWAEEAVDARLRGEFNVKQAVRMVEIGISCVEEDRSRRPTMDAVVRLLLNCDDV
uniref:non-specific serine/threonine protein kinase n=1 Tax=Kalanchoe fedtschenkoi TaxID=63787 RepID=A0A7N0U8J2_KALFE